MTMSGYLDTREFAKFVADASGDTAIRVLLSGTSDLVDLTLTGMLYQSVETGITAGTTQTQAGATALTKMLNIVATVATANDGVKLMSAEAGAQQKIVNRGANNLKIWPFLGDDLGAGVNAAIVIPPGAKIMFDAEDVTTWSV